MSIAPSVACSCYWTASRTCNRNRRLGEPPPPRTSLTPFRGGCELNLGATLLLPFGFHNGSVTSRGGRLLPDILRTDDRPDRLPGAGGRTAPGPGECGHDGQPRDPLVRGMRRLPAHRR